MKKLFFTIIVLVCMLKTFSAQGADDHPYEVGVDDVLEINILQPEKLTSVTTISSDGLISLPYIGNVKVKGLTLNQIQDLVQTELANGYMKYPLVTVSLKESHSQKFFISGSVAKPGAYTFVEKTSVFNAITMAGGLSKYDPSTRVSILRTNWKNDGYRVITVDVGAVISGQKGADTILRPGDSVTVSEGKFFVYGEINKPGVYAFEGDTTVLKAISMAGGFIRSGAYAKVKILRPNEEKAGNDTIEINLDEAIKGSVQANIPLKSGDTLVVSEGKFFVYGEVNKPGVYPMEEELTALKAIAIAGGFTKYGSSSRIKILRYKDDKSGYESIKVNLKEAMNGNSGVDIFLKPNDTVVIFEGIF